MLKIPCKLPNFREPVYLVGGSVRDLLLKRTPVDYDIVMPAQPESYARELAAMHDTRVIELGRDEKRIFRIVGQGVVYDISRIKGDSIQADLMQRDFTVNAMAYDVRSKGIIDITHGRRDLSAGQVRMVSPSIFDQDPVRLLRAFRMTAQLGFTIEKKTTRLIREKKHLIRRAAGERIRDEWLGILQPASTAGTLAEMVRTGLLTELFPALKDLAELKPNQYHAFDALTHTLKTVGHLETLLPNICHAFPQSVERMNRVLNRQRRINLKCAAIFHDMGKPAAASTDAKGRPHYYGHEKIGAIMADKACRQFRFSNQERKSIALIVRQHLRPLFLFNQSSAGLPVKRARTRFFLACGPLTPDIILHAVADSRGKRADPDRHHVDFVHFADSLLQDYFTGFQINKLAPRLIGGRDLIEVFGLSPSPVFSAVLSRVEEARMAGEIHSRADALDLADRILKIHGDT